MLDRKIIKPKVKIAVRPKGVVYAVRVKSIKKEV